MKHEIYGHLRPVSTRRFSAAKYGRCAAFSTVNLTSDPRSCGICQNKKPPAEAGGLRARIPSRVPCITRARPKTRCPRTSVRGFFTNVAVPFRPIHTNASAVSAGAGPYFRGAIVKLARPWLTLRTAAE